MDNSFYFAVSGYSNGQAASHTVLKIEMDFNPLGVESDNYPTIHVFINLKDDSSFCRKAYYYTKRRDSVYTLSKKEIISIKKLLSYSAVKKLKNKYSLTISDQPTSTTKIYTDAEKFVIKDYGLQGEYPLQELYKIVYKF